MSIIWTGFVVLVPLFLALDLDLSRQRAHVISIREALIWSFAWIMTALAFDAGVYYLYEHHVLGIGLEIGHALTGRVSRVACLESVRSPRRRAGPSCAREAG